MPLCTQPISRYYFVRPNLPNTHFYGVPTDCALVADAFFEQMVAAGWSRDGAVMCAASAIDAPPSQPQTFSRARFGQVRCVRSTPRLVMQSHRSPTQNELHRKADAAIF